MISKEQIREEIKVHEKLEAYCISAKDPQEAKKHRSYIEAYTLVLGE